MHKQQYLAIAAIAACFCALAVIGLGAFTRLMDAGLGCPDWPGCYGHLTVPMTALAKEQASSLYPTGTLDVFKAWAEMIHRYVAGSLGLMIVVIVYLIFNKELRSRANIILGCSLLGLLMYQILLGQWTVTFKLLPIVVTQHLLGGFLILTILWLIYLNNSATLSGKVHSKGIKIGAVIGLMLLLLQIFLGAWTSTNYASFSCPDFPFCMNTHPLMTMHFSEAFTFLTPVGINYEGGVLSEEARQTIQMMHRLGALVVTLYLIVFTTFFIKSLRADHRLLKSIYLIWCLLFVQLCLGMINVIYQLPLVTAIGHNLVAVVLLLSIVTFVFKLFVKGK